MKIFKALLAFVGAILCSVQVMAAQSQYLHQPRISTRVMGMGGAYTAVADDYLSLFYNPAGLARLEKGQFVADITAGLTPSIIGFESDLSGAGSNAVNIQNTLSNYFGSHFASRVGLGGTWVRPGWGISFQPVDLTVEVDVHGTAGVTAGVQAFQDSLLQYGIAWNLGESKAMSIGFAPKAVYRAYIDKDLTVFDLVASSSLFKPSDASEAFMFDFDLGWLYSLNVDAFTDSFWSWLKWAKPTFGVAVRNVLDYGSPADFHLYNAQSSAYPLDLGRRFDVGTKLDLPEFWVFKPRAMIDFRDLNTPQASFKKCSHLGFELLWKAFGWLNGGYRVGLSEGYLTAGVSAELGIFLLDLATYSEEIGTTQSPRESRRYMLQMSLDF